MNISNIMQTYGQFRQNPMAMLSRKYNIPRNLNDPEGIIQHLLDSGQITQGQLNQAMQAKNNPMFRQMFIR